MLDHGLIHEDFDFYTQALNSSIETFVTLISGLHGTTSTASEAKESSEGNNVGHILVD